MPNVDKVSFEEIRNEKLQIPDDLYGILGLDIEGVRKLNNDDYKKTIKKAYRRKILIWHPDKNFGHDGVAKEINEAYNFFMKMSESEEERASYHNALDYEQGFFSKRRWKAIFWPDCNTDKQRKAFRRKMGLTCVSFVLATVGVATSIATAGVAIPAVVICGAIIGGGLTGAGFQSLGCIMSKKFLDEIDIKTWFKKAAIGFIGGIIFGGVSLGITAGIVGFGSAGLSSFTAGEFIGITSATGAVGGVVSSVVSTAIKIFVNKEKVTWKQFGVRLASNTVIGAGAGALGGLIPTDMADGIGGAVAQTVSKQATISGTKGLMKIPINVFEEYKNDSVGNQTFSEHLKKEFEDAFLNVVRDTFVFGVGGSAGHGISETFLDETSDLGNAVSGIEQNPESYLSANEGHANVPGLENETNEDLGEGEEGDDDREKERSKQPYYARKKGTSRPKNANVNKSKSDKSERRPNR